MRTEKELWELVLKYPDYIELGVCCCVRHLFFNMNEMEHEEYVILRKSLEINLPPKRHGSLYCWETFQLQPRIDWINERIKQLEDENN